MTSIATPKKSPPMSPEALRVRAFGLLMIAAAVWGALVGAFQNPAEFALPLLMPPYLLWIISDLRARGVVGGSFAFQLVLSLFPVWGLLIYLVWTRRLVGVLQWGAFLFALAIPAGLAVVLARGIGQLARGERW